MNDHSCSSLTRRKWLTAVSTPAIAAALVPLSPSAAQPAGPVGQGRGARVYNIRDFGAQGDGKTLDSAALQAAIDACARDGGGTVLVPSGTFVIGTTELKSNVTLHLAASATLLGSFEPYRASTIPLKLLTDRQPKCARLNYRGG